MVLTLTTFACAGGSRCSHIAMWPSPTHPTPKFRTQHPSLLLRPQPGRLRAVSIAVTALGNCTGMQSQCLLRLPYFTERHILTAHPSCSLCQNVLPLKKKNRHIGVTLVSKITYVPGVQVSDTSPVDCTVFLPAKAEQRSIVCVDHLCVSIVPLGCTGLLSPAGCCEELGFKCFI